VHPTALRFQRRLVGMPPHCYNLRSGCITIGENTPVPQKPPLSLRIMIVCQCLLPNGHGSPCDQDIFAIGEKAPLQAWASILNNSLLVVASKSRAVYQGLRRDIFHDNTARLLDATTSKELFKIDAHAWSGAFSPIANMS